eukprot:4327019-Prymnesium_polylepis.1
MSDFDFIARGLNDARRAACHSDDPLFLAPPPAINSRVMRLLKLAESRSASSECTSQMSSKSSRMSICMSQCVSVSAFERRRAPAPSMSVDSPKWSPSRSCFDGISLLRQCDCSTIVICTIPRAMKYMQSPTQPCTITYSRGGKSTCETLYERQLWSHGFGGPCWLDCDASRVCGRVMPGLGAPAAARA